MPPGATSGLYDGTQKVARLRRIDVSRHQELHIRPNDHVIVPATVMKLWVSVCVRSLIRSARVGSARETAVVDPMNVPHPGQYMEYEHLRALKYR